jgi:thiol:disulfide interchange protein
LLITFLLSFIKKKTLSIPLRIIGLGTSAFVLFSAYSFTSFTNKQRNKFDIPTAVIFEKSNFETVLKKAHSENKPIFMDFYTGWCSPCLAFTKNVLTDEEVGAHMNNTFLNLKYDAEKGEGIALAKKYNINSYPTFLILDKNGVVLENLSVTYSWVPQKKEMIEVSKKYKEITPLD